MSGQNLVTRRPAASSAQPALKAPESIKAKDLSEQYMNNDGDTLGAILWAPTHKKTAHWITLVKSYLLELIASFFMVFFTVFSVVSAVNGSGDTAVRSLLVAIASGGSYFMVTGWLRNPEEELPRHASWLVTLFYCGTLRFGVFHSLIYLGVQTLGAFIASLVLSGLGPGGATEEVWIPVLGGTTNQSWIAEIFATALILFNLGYNHMAGNEVAKEDEQARHGETMASLMRLIATLVFFRLGHWTFDPIIYLGGLWATCHNTGCLSAETPTHLGVGFFMGVPFIGLVTALVFYVIALALTGTYKTRRYGAKGAEMRRTFGPDVQKSIHTSYTGQ